MDAYQTSLYTAILIASVIIGIIIVYFIISMIRQQRHNQELYKSKIRAEIKTLEEERARVASDLHDELGPLLSSVKLKMNCLDISSAEDQAQLERINEHIDVMISRLRDISNDLMPSVLLRKGLVTAIEDVVADVNISGKLKITFVVENMPQFTEEETIHLYRIIREIIHNTIKHAKAESLSIELIVKNNKLVLTSRDDGIGFNHSLVASEGKGFGLRSLVSRTEVLNGDMFIDSRPGKGTQYIFELPFKHQTNHD